jgi:HlyD family secretion protein
VSNELTPPIRAAAAVLSLLFLAGFAGCGKNNPGGDAVASEAPVADDSLVVLVAPVEIRTIAETVGGLGRCEALPEKIASLTPAVEGRVDKILVTLGESVSKGQPIIRFDDRIAQDNLSEKQATRDELKAALKLLEAPPRAEELKSLELAVEQAKLALDKATTAAERLRPLVQRKEISDAQMYEADLAVTQARMQQQTAESQLAATKLGPKREAIQEAEAKIATADAAVQTAEAQLKLHTLESPIDGALDSLSCRLGQTISAGTAIGEIIDLRQVHVVVWLPAREAGRVRVGQLAQIGADMGQRDKTATAGESRPDSASLTAEVKFIGHVADLQTGNVPVRILVDNSNGRLNLGQTVSAAITVNKKDEVLAVPATALFDVGEGPILNVVRDGKSARARPDLGLRDKHWVEIVDTDLSEKLKPGELVIVEGGYNLPEGNKVSTQSAAPSSLGGSPP